MKQARHLLSYILIVIIVSCNTLGIFAVDLASQADWIIKVNKIEEVDKLSTKEEEVLYTGEVLTKEIIDTPAEGNKYVILNIEVVKQNSTSKALNKRNFMMITSEDKKVSTMTENILDRHNYNNFSSNDININQYEGDIIFEINENEKLEQLKLNYNSNEIKVEVVDNTKNINNSMKDQNSIVNNDGTNIEIQESFFTAQRQKENIIYQTYLEGKYTINNPLIVNDPYEIAPLTALVIFDTVEPNQVVVEIEGKDEYSTVTHTFETFNTHHELPIIGLYADKNNKVTLILKNQSGKTTKKEIFIQTDQLPSNTPTITIDKSIPEKMEPGFTFLFSGRNEVIDHNGEVRWYTTLTSQDYNNRFQNGRMYFSIGQRNKFFGRPYSKILEMDLLGKVYNIYDVPAGNHHDTTEMPNGNILITSQDLKSVTVEDVVVEIDRELGQVINKWDFRNILDANRKNEIGSNYIDWLHMNAVVYDSNDNSLIISGRKQSVVAKVSYPEGELKWILGSHDNWGADYEKYLLTPEGEDFEWQWSQHAPMILPDLDNNPETLDLILFDNGNYRSFDIDKAVAPTDNYSRIVHYRINEKTKTIKQIWEYGKERGSELYSAEQGDADYLFETGNILGTFAAIMKDGNGNALNDASPEQKDRYAKLIEVNPSNNEVVFEATIRRGSNYSVYRSERMNIYPDKWEFSLLDQNGINFSNYGDTHEITTLFYDITEPSGDGEMTYEIEDIYIKDDELYIKGYSFFPHLNAGNTIISIVFENDKSDIRYQIYKARRDDLATKYPSQMNYIQSGINEHIPLKVFGPGKYEIGILLQNGSEKSYVKTDYYFEIQEPQTVVDHDVLLKQKNIEKEILNEYGKKNYTLVNPYIKVNPYETSPLSALLMFETNKPANITVEIEGKDELSTIKHTFTNNMTHHEIPLYGLYEDTNNTVKLTATYKDGTIEKSTIKVKTDSIQGTLPTIDISQVDAEKMKEGITFFTPAKTASNLFGIDHNGDVRYYNEVKGRGQVIEVLQNNRLLMSSEKLIEQPYYGVSVYETNLLGKIYTEYLTPGFHHDVRELANGNLLYAGQNFNRNTVEDYLVELDRKTGKVVNTWDMKGILDLKRYIATDNHLLNNFSGNKDKALHDWFHMNSVWYDEKEDAIIVSGRHQDMVVSIDYSTKNINWILTDSDNPYLKDSMKQYILEPIGENFEYQYAQHAAMINEKGNLMVFDNGNNRAKYAKDAILPENNYSRVVEYKVNKEDMTVEQVWEYGKERADELFSMYISDVDYLDDGHVLAHFGGIVKTPDGAATDQLSYALNNGELKSTTVELVEDQIVFEVNLDNNSYRAERMPLYQADSQEEKIVDEENKRLGTMYKIKKENIKLNTDIAVPVEVKEIEYDGLEFIMNAETLLKNTNEVYIQFIKEEKKYTYKGTVDKDGNIKINLYTTDMPKGTYNLMVYLTDKNNEHYYSNIRYQLVIR